MDIVDRFLGYTKINTTTNQENGYAGIMPSSPGQMVLAQKIKWELEELGLVCSLEKNAILTATLPANTTQKIPTVSFFAHLDTSSERTEDTIASIVSYRGGDIQLNESVSLSMSEFPELKNYQDQQIIVTDGNCLLGADDKAAIAAIVDAIKYLIENPQVKHGEVKIAFVPDEEQGMQGAKVFDIEKFGADFAYTLDCCGIGELIHENWNAGSAVLTFHGQSAHPMSAKGKMKNSLLLAHKFIALLPAGECPEYTENREGYYWVNNMEGNTGKTTMRIDIRDFSKEGYGRRCKFLEDAAASFNKLYGAGSLDLILEHSYENVFDSLQGKNSYPVDIALEAYRRNNIEPKIIPMRGGYDGAVLSQKGLPCPNLFTGAHNFHSIYEYLPIESLKAASKIVVDIIRITHEKN